MQTTATHAPDRRRVLLPLASLLAAASIAIASGATFSASSVNPANLVTSGAFTHDNSADGSAIFVGNDLKPGDSTSGSVTLTNVGDYAAAFVLEADSTNGFADLLSLRITDGSRTVYDGGFSGLTSASLGTFAIGESRTYDFVVTLSDAAGNGVQGERATATYTWTSTAVD